MKSISPQEVLALIEEIRSLSFCNTEGSRRINALKASVEALAASLQTLSHLQTVYEEKRRQVHDNILQMETMLDK